MRCLTLVSLLLAACEPPPAVDLLDAEDIAITILYPPGSNADGDGAFEILPRPDGDYVITVVVDVQGVELKDPYVEGIVDDEAEGHWHLDISSGGTLPASERFAEFVIPGSEVTTDTLLVLTASVRENTHGPRLVNEEEVTDTVEVALVVP